MILTRLLEIFFGVLVEIEDVLVLGLGTKSVLLVNLVALVSNPQEE